MKGEHKVLWAGFQAEGTGGKVSLRVATDEAREVGKGWSAEDLEFHLVDIHFFFPFISILRTC